MSKKCDIMERRHVFTNCSEDLSLVVKRDPSCRRSHDYEKKLKREIANSNERRRMQSINMGFEMLKQLLPSSIDGEKLSKASILQLTAQYIETLLSKISKLETELCECRGSESKSENDVLFKPDLNKIARVSTKLTEKSNDKYIDSITCYSDSATGNIDDTFSMRKETNMSVECNVQSNNRKHKLFDIASTATSAARNRSGKQSKTSIFRNVEDKCTDDGVKVIYCEESDLNETPGSLEHLVAAIQQVEGEQFVPADGKLKCQLIDACQFSSTQLPPGTMFVNVERDQNTSTTSTSSVSMSDNPSTTVTASATNATTTDTITTNTELTKSNNTSLENVKNAVNSSTSTSNKSFKYLLKKSSNEAPVIKPTISPFTEKILVDYSRNPYIFKSTSKVVINENICKISIPPKYHHRPDVILHKNKSTL